LPDYFNEADLYASATYSDGSSISLLEAMGCGLPVVVPDRHGNREWVRPGVNGWLYPPGDAGALRAAMLDALTRSELRAAMRDANLAAVRERADWERNFPKLLEVYDSLLRSHNGRREFGHA
jgi:glycosyltransferase involved in cell wall biosynthesis